VPGRRLDDDVTAHDLRAELVQPLGELANAGLERWRGIHVTESDLQGHLHVSYPRSRLPGRMLAVSGALGNSRMYVEAALGFPAPARIKGAGS
jgi:hypothetical protein